MFIIRFYRIHVDLFLHAIWLLPHHSPGEFYLTPLDPHVQVMELGACGFSPLLIRVRSGSVDLQLTVQSSILPGPCVPPEFFLCKLVSALFLFILVHFLVYLYVTTFILFILVYLHVFPHLRISVI